MNNYLPLDKQIKPIHRTKLIHLCKKFIYENNINELSDIYDKEDAVNHLISDIFKIFLKY
jgi:hypothetical protein